MEVKTITERLRERHGIETLNDMQQLMAATDARHIVLLAPTGSGKTAAFALRLLRDIGPSDGKIQAVVLAPSRELVMQIAGVIRPVAQGLKTVALYGGHAMADEENSLSPVPDIVVATPGRLLDHMRRGHLDVAPVRALVLDEYDKSLELGFYDEMKRIVGRMRSLRLVILTSATPLDEIPAFVPLDGAETFDFTGKGARSRLQRVLVPSEERDKLPVLEALLRSLPNGRALVFANHRESAERVHDFLKKRGFPAGLYHGGLEQRERQLAVDLLDNGTTPVLVTTDLASRGLDIPGVEYVVHYHLPPTAESWTHRNGRTARQGAEGTAFTIVAEGENVPEWVKWERELRPSSYAENPIHSDVATLYFNAGRKEKISRGDIAGFLIRQGGLTPGEVGKISVSDHSAIAAVPRDKAATVVAAVAPQRLKNTRVRVSLLK